MSGGLAAPDGYVWCRGRDGLWHLQEAAVLDHAGTARTTARSVCGLWASLLPTENAWTEVTARATLEPRRVCAACLTAAAEAQRRERLQASPARQARLL